MKNLGIFSLLILLFFSSCRKDINETNVTQTVEDPIIEQFTPPSSLISADVMGQIIDENNEPVADATVRMNGQDYLTDAFGHFFVENETMNELGTLVQVEKDGYFEGSRRFFPKEGTQNLIKIQLLTKNFDLSFNATNGGTINFANGASVKFDPNSIKDANGNAYVGEVLAAAKWLDPSAVETFEQMPGALLGVSQEVEQVALGTYGMIAIELVDDNFQPLNIQDGKTAEITVPLPSTMVANAPTSIPLWSYDEEHGYWVEEGEATLQNGNYVGEVSHFSFWNCDIPFDAVFFDATFTDDTGNPLINYMVLIEVTDGSTGGSNAAAASGWTNGDGYVGGYVPANVELEISVLDICGVVIYSQVVGPFNTDTSLGSISLTPSTLNATTIEGNLVDCNGDPVNNGIVTATFDGEAVYYYVTSGNFGFTFSSCASATDIDVVGVNIDNMEQGTAVSATPGTTNNLGDLSTCGTSLNNFISVTIDDNTQTTTYIILNAVAGTSPASTFTNITAASATGNEFVSFGFDGQTVGDYSSSNYVEAISVSTWNLFTQGGFSSFEVTQYDTKLVGTFGGELTDPNSGLIVTVTGTFNIDL
ncbi:MAG: astroprincin family protein [Bacteroidota bacterium]